MGNMCPCGQDFSVHYVCHRPHAHLQNPDKFITSLITTSALTAHSYTATPQNQLWHAAETIHVLIVCSILVEMLCSRVKHKLFISLL